jgi:hypothetical protein
MSNHITWLPIGWLRAYAVWLLPIAAILAALCPAGAQAQAAEGGGFNIQVSPSPLVLTLKPGEQQTATLTVRNLSNHAETLVPRLNSFTIDSRSEKIELKSEVPQGLNNWISFKEPKLTIPAGASQPLHIVYDTPPEAGFSYTLAITLNPEERAATPGGANIQAAVAVFNLITIDRPGAKRVLEITEFKSDKSRYEFLPANFTLRVKNTGNVIGQPTGNVFIQRSFADNEPLATIPINKSGAYILPDTSRSFSPSWQDGFPRYATTNTNGKADKQLSWEWRKLNNLRFGKYVAKVVLVYNDGQRDVPLVASYSFWVIPWRLIFGAVLVGGLLLTGLIAWGRLIFKGTKRVRKYATRK